MTKISDITTDDINRDILHCLKKNEHNSLTVRGDREGEDDDYSRNMYDEYCPESTVHNDHEWRWLGYFIGKNTSLRELKLQEWPDNIEPFSRGIKNNRSIRTVAIHNIEGDRAGENIFRSMSPFLENNNNLSKLVVEDCEFGEGCVRQLSLMVRNCNKSLKSVRLQDNTIELNDNWEDESDDDNGVEEKHPIYEPMADVIQALCAHPQLERLELSSMNIARQIICAAHSQLCTPSTSLAIPLTMNKLMLCWKLPVSS